MLAKVGEVVETVQVLTRSGLVGPMPPKTLIGVAKASKKWDRTAAGAVAGAAVRHPDRRAIIDEDGEITYAELHRVTNALTTALKAKGVKPGDGVGLLCRDHRHFIQSLVAISKAGAHLLLLNTSFSGKQMREVLEREGGVLLIHDDEFDDLVDGVTVPTLNETEARELIASTSDAEPDAPPEPGRTVILTSGTTGTPKGARRAPTTPVDAIVGFLERVPIRANATHVVVAPLFHSWGFAHMGLCIMLGNTVVVRRRFDPEATLALISKHRARLVSLVPVMAQRILDLPDETRAKYDCSSLEIAAFGGSAIPGDLAIRFMDEFGDVVYNTYGSTEVAVVTIATPQDLREDAHTAGKPVKRVVVKLLGPDGAVVPDGQPGRIFAGSSAAFEGYTGGGGKEIVEGLMSTGDVGSFDAKGRLTIEGRDDDMIVSGGENVFPREVEDLISDLDGVEEASVVGVPDDDFGQRLRAVVVLREGVSLTEDDIRSAVKQDLARYKVPRDVIFTDELPRTATGKVLKRELVTLPAAPADPAR
jgi:acyl-CoA synthetase (AMP-forming)/AMP-acid ligase II